MSLRRYDDFTGLIIPNSTGGQNDDGTTYYIQDHDTNLIFGSVTSYLKYKAENPSTSDFNILNVTFPHILFNNYANSNFLTPVSTIVHGTTVFLGAQDPLGTTVSGLVTWTASPSSIGTFNYPVTGASGYATFTAASTAAGQMGVLTVKNGNNQTGSMSVYIN